MTVQLFLRKGEALTCDDCKKLVKGKEKKHEPFYIGGKCLASMLCENCAVLHGWVR